MPVLFLGPAAAAWADQIGKDAAVKRAVNQPLGQLYLFGGIYLKEMLSPDAGTIISQHTHAYDHISYLAAGAVRVWKDERWLGDFQAPAGIRIEAGLAHRFQTLVDGTLILCVHAVAEAEEPEIIRTNPLPLED